MYEYEVLPDCTTSDMAEYIILCRTVQCIMNGTEKGVQNRFVSKLLRTFTTFPAKGTVKRIGDNIESEVRLIYFDMNQKCRRMVCVCHQGSADAWVCVLSPKEISQSR